jgi:capsular polysaccharide transport system permease protein
MKNASNVREVVSFRIALRRYLGIMAALLLQEYETWHHAPVRKLLKMIEPMGNIAIICFVGIFIFNHGAVVGDSQVLFIASGFFPKYLFFYTARYTPNKSSRNLFPTEQRLDYMLVNVIVKIVEFVILGIVLFGSIYLLITDQAMPVSYDPMLEAVIAMAMLGFGYGAVNLALRQIFWFWPAIVQVINMTLIMICGVFFIVDFLPPDIRYWVSFIPNIHAIVLFRQGFYPRYPALILDTSYLAYCAIIAGLVGFVLERITRRAIAK